MASLKQRLHRKNSSGSYDVVYLETLASLVKMDDGTTLVAKLSSMDTTIAGKANASHGTHVSFTTTAPAMNGTAAVGSATTVARSDHVHPVDTSRAAASHNHAAGNITSGTFDAARIPTLAASKVTTGTFAATGIQARSGTDYTTARIRNIQASTTDLTAGTSPLGNGDIYFVYE